MRCASLAADTRRREMTPRLMAQQIDEAGVHYRLMIADLGIAVHVGTATWFDRVGEAFGWLAGGVRLLSDEDAPMLVGPFGRRIRRADELGQGGGAGDRDRGGKIPTCPADAT